MSSDADTITRVVADSSPGWPQVSASVTGALVGRYVLHDAIGRGGAGEVFAAYDPELDRKVAIKLVRADSGHGGSSGWTARLRVEAQTIAKLSHPNIVAVYDVGEIATGHPLFEPGTFIVMELIAGRDLTAWVDTEHGWRAALDVLLPVGRALAAAHAARLVHRDVKPANILLGDDGRARLVDFGLARAMGGDRPAVATVEGTPATMAPEQHTGAPADARSDQYGWCATLHALVHGVYPFHGEDIAGLVRAKLRDAPRRPRRAPRWLDDAIARGLAPDPTRRFGDMDELVAALERGRGRLARRLTAAGAVLVLGGVGAVAAWSGARVPEARCLAEGDAGIARVWGESQRASAIAGIEATAVAYAGETATLVDGTVGSLLERWRVERADACAAASAADQPAEVSAARLACLDRTLDEIDDLATLLATADAQVVAGAATAAERVSPPEECSEPATSPTSDPALEQALRRARLHLLAGAFASAETIATDSLERATGLGDLRAQARAHAQLCRLYHETGRSRSSRDHCDLAVTVAEQAGDDVLATEAHLVHARHAESLAVADWSLKIAEARLASLPERRRSQELAADLALVRATLHLRHGREIESNAELARAIALREEALGTDHPSLVAPLNALGNNHRDQGRHAEGQAVLERALAITERAHGRSHPHVGLLLNNIALTASARGRLDEAWAMLGRSIAIKEAAYGASSPVLLTSLTSLADLEVERGKLDAAWDAVDRARRIEAAVPELADDDAQVELALARVLVARRRCSEAVPWIDAAERLDHDEATGTIATEVAALRGRCATER